jgi:HPr kinase/phosphorylase
MAAPVPDLLSDCRQARELAERNYTNIHANSLIIGNQGILIFGKPGFGKTSLMLFLLEHASASNKFAAMIADDQSMIVDANNQLIARCPLPIQGKLEIRGHGIINASFLPSSVINLVVEILPREKIDRMSEAKTKTINGIKLPLIYVPRSDLQQSKHIITAALGS